MQYLRDPKDIRDAIADLSRTKILWLDTEVADWMTQQPRLSLIQVFAGEMLSAMVLDVLDRGDLIEEFIERIMVNAEIEKVFHNASFDKRFLGKTRARNVTCTLQLARKIPKHVLAVPDRKLATLVRAFCPGSTIDKTEQTSDWGRRPLTDSQLHYAGMDAVHLERVHHELIARSQLTRSSVVPSSTLRTIPTATSNAVTNPAAENIAALTQRYRQIAEQWRQLDDEVKEIKDRLKAAMQAQSITETNGFQLSQQQRISHKVSVAELGNLLQASDSSLDFQISLTKAQREQLGDLLDRLEISEQTTQIVQLKIRDLEP
ncbi:MAG: ribonuclease D [Cyanobacteria bacterium J06641_5]